MIWVGGGAGMAPPVPRLCMTKTLHTTDREMHYFYGARALNEVFYLDDFLGIEKEFPEFPLPSGTRPSGSCSRWCSGREVHRRFCSSGDAEYLPERPRRLPKTSNTTCGPGPMSKAVVAMLTDLGVEEQSILFDNFGG